MRKPKVGETWWSNGGEKIGPLVGYNDDEYPLSVPDIGGTGSKLYSHYGVRWFKTEDHPTSLSHIYSDADGNVINPTFEDRNEEPMKPTKPAKSDPLDADIEAAKERVRNLEALKAKLAERAANLSAGLALNKDIAALRASLYPKGRRKK